MHSNVLKQIQVLKPNEIRRPDKIKHLDQRTLEGMSQEELVDYAKKLSSSGHDIKEILMSDKMLKKTLIKDIIATEDGHKSRQNSSATVNKGLTLFASERKTPSGQDSNELQFVSLSYRQDYVPVGLN